jgi:hypothetical protein
MENDAFKALKKMFPKNIKFSTIEVLLEEGLNSGIFNSKSRSERQFTVEKVSLGINNIVDGWRSGR